MGLVVSPRISDLYISGSQLSPETKQILHVLEGLFLMIRLKIAQSICIKHI